MLSKNENALFSPSPVKKKKMNKPTSVSKMHAHLKFCFSSAKLFFFFYHKHCVIKYPHNEQQQKWNEKLMHLTSCPCIQQNNVLHSCNITIFTQRDDPKWLESSYRRRKKNRNIAKNWGWIFDGLCKKKNKLVKKVYVVMWFMFHWEQTRRERKY